MDNDLSRKIGMLDNAYSDYLMKKINNIELEKRVGIILTNLDFSGGKRNFTVSIVKNKGKEPFFGMRIMPVLDDISELASDIVAEKKSLKEICTIWASIQNWYLEIDDSVFDRTELNFIPKELTALTLHEIGHILYSDRTIEKFYRAYQESYMRVKIVDRASLKYLYMLYMIPLSLACAAHNYTDGNNEIKQEKFADKVLEDFGYSEALLTAINKIVKAFGNDSGISESEGNKKISASINWCNLNANDLIRRKNTLKDDLFYNTIKTNSSYTKAMCLKILYELGIGLRENYSGAVVENYNTFMMNYSPEHITEFYKTYESFYDIHTLGQLEKNMNMVTESYKVAMESKRGEIKLPSQYDIDSIEVECDRISNHADRIYVLDLIYNKLDQIDQFENLIEGSHTEERKYEDKIKSMKSQLQEMRKLVLSKRCFGSEYKLFVKYPKGYEG